jgi:hypothetical protein
MNKKPTPFLPLPSPQKRGWRGVDNTMS